MKPAFVLMASTVAVSILSALASARPAAVVKLEVPVVVRPNDHTGPASLAMVMGFYGADSIRRRRADEAFDAKSKSVSVQDLAATARRLGYSARVAEPGIDSLASFLRAGVPPILCVEPREGVPGKSRYFVVTRWETLGTRFFVLDGSPRPRSIGWSVLQSVWQPGGGRALIVTPRH